MLCLGCLGSLGCGSKPKDLIIGKWEQVHAQLQPGEIVDEYTSDGRCLGYRNGKLIREKKYVIADDGTLELKESDGKTYATFKVTITKDEMTWKGGGGTDNFKRAK